MKTFLFLILFSLSSFAVYSQSNNLPSLLVEANAGYALGINLDNAMQIDAKLMYPFQRLGFAIEVGAVLTPDKTTAHVFLGPMLFLLNNEKWRIPIALGFNLLNGESFRYGIGGFISLHRRLLNHLYVGFNLGISYAFVQNYTEVIGY